MLDYRNAQADTSSPQEMLRLTIFFFGSFLALMVAFAAVAFVITYDTTSSRVVWSVTAAIASLSAAYCAEGAWRILRAETSPPAPTDSRLDD